VRSKSSDQQANDQAIDQQSVDDLVQLLIEFKVFDTSRSSFKNESVEYSSLSKTSSMSDVSNSSSSSSQKRSFDKRQLKRRSSDVDQSIKEEIIAMNLANRIEEMKRRRQQSKRNVTLADVDQANIVEGKRVKFASSKYPKSDYAQLLTLIKRT
jgi:outer membrane scaffolding protein for murein synthesis (MipA/OmpV family)